MTPTEITRVETYLRRVLGNPKIEIPVPKRKGASVEVTIDKEFLGTVHRDDEDGEVSYALHITILDEDLPPAPKK
ncbi:MAG: DUF3126 family protein [Pseudomonadota bacterium]|nr:DUF3126 family protein [Pseudomonadota bacterium]